MSKYLVTGGRNFKESYKQQYKFEKITVEVEFFDDGYIELARAWDKNGKELECRDTKILDKYLESGSVSDFGYQLMQDNKLYNYLENEEVSEELGEFPF